MADLRQWSGAANRTADALLRGVGGRAVMLRMPVAALTGSDAEQMGLAKPEFNDIALAPVVFRRLRDREREGKASVSELMVSASAVEALVGSLAYDSAEVLFSTAAGVLVGDVLLAVEAATAAEAFGQPYLYRLVLRGEVGRII